MATGNNSQPKNVLNIYKLEPAKICGRAGLKRKLRITSKDWRVLTLQDVVRRSKTQMFSVHDAINVRYTVVAFFNPDVESHSLPAIMHPQSSESKVE